MYILAVESTGPKASVAMIDEEGRCEEISVPGRMDHLKNILPMISSFDIDKREICAAAASVGPGSFTGIRIGVSAVRGIAQGLGIPVIAVSSLEAFCYGDDRESVICPMIDARRGQIYGAAYRWEGEALLTAAEPGPYMIEDFLDLLPAGERIRIYGDAYKKYGEAIFSRNLNLSLAPAEEIYQRADRVARAALVKYRKGETLEYEELLPEYMRRSEAEVKREERLRNEDKEGR